MTRETCTKPVISRPIEDIKTTREAGDIPDIEIHTTRGLRTAEGPARSQT